MVSSYCYDNCRCCRGGVYSDEPGGMRLKFRRLPVTINVLVHSYFKQKVKRTCEAVRVVKMLVSRSKDGDKRTFNNKSSE